MRNVTTIFTIALMCFGLFHASKAQPITITASDIPVPSGPLDGVGVVGPLPGGPPNTPNGMWNYSNLQTAETFTLEYYPETIDTFVNAGIDFYQFVFKALTTQGSGYNYYSEYDLTSTGIAETAMDIYRQPFALGTITGNVNDSLIIEQQQLLNLPPFKFMHFPMTYGTKWTSQARRAVDFTLKLPSQNIPVASCQHVFHRMRTDTIVGWGKMKVMTPQGPSVWYDVLVDRFSITTIDSFYLNGAPAPASLLAGLGASQGQVTTNAHAENVYRVGSFMYLFRTWYGSDATFTMPTEYYIGTTGLTPSTSNSFDRPGNLGIVMYPNPGDGKTFNIKLIGSYLTATRYTVSDLQGQVIETGIPAFASKDQVDLRFSHHLPSGQFVLSLFDGLGQIIMSEQFNVR